MENPGPIRLVRDYGNWTRGKILSTAAGVELRAKLVRLGKAVPLAEWSPGVCRPPMPGAQYETASVATSDVETTETPAKPKRRRRREKTANASHATENPRTGHAAG